MSPQPPGGPQDPAPYLAPKQVAERLGVSSSTVIRLVDSGALTGAINVGRGQIRRRGLRIPSESVSAYQAAAAVAPNEAA